VCLNAQFKCIAQDVVSDILGLCQCKCSSYRSIIAEL